MLNKVRWYIATSIDKIKNAIKPDTGWECYFCKKVFVDEHPRVNAYKDGKPLYQCEECRIRLDFEDTPANRKLDDSGG